MNILNLLLGLCTGIVVGLTGAGGGILAIPALVMGGMDMLAAKPVALLAVTMGAALGAVAGLRQGLVRYRAALYMSALGAVFSPVGSWLALRVSQSWLAVLFSGVLLLVAWRSWRLAGRQVPQGAVEKQTDTQAKPCQVDAGSGRFIWQPACFGALGLIGSVAGLMSGMLGVGGRLCGCAYAAALYKFALPQRGAYIAGRDCAGFGIFCPATDCTRRTVWRGRLGFYGQHHGRRAGSALVGAAHTAKLAATRLCAAGAAVYGFAAA